MMNYFILRILEVSVMKKIICFVVSCFLMLTCFAGVATGSYSPSNSYGNMAPVAEWLFDEGKGVCVTDSSGNYLDGTLFGAAWVKGVRGSALAFDGNDFVEVPHDNILNNGNMLSVEAWICPEEMIRYQKIITKTPGQYYDYSLFCGDKDNVGFAVKVGSTAYSVYSPANSVPRGNWTHVVGVYDGKNVIIYINGKEAGKNPAAGPIMDHGGVLRIGGDAYASNYQGRIDEIRIYDRALTANEVNALYQGNSSKGSNSEYNCYANNVARNRGYGYPSSYDYYRDYTYNRDYDYNRCGSRNYDYDYNRFDNRYDYNYRDFDGMRKSFSKIRRPFGYIGFRY
jgi:hypothetical protein